MSEKLMLEENPQVSAKDLDIKLKKLESYIQKTQTRIKLHEKAIGKLQKALKEDLVRADEAVKAIKKIKVSV